MIAVGVGIAPMLQALNELLPSSPHDLECDTDSLDQTQIVLLYGVRTAYDILLREKLESFARDMSPHNKGRFRVVYGVGSRWSRVHMGGKTSDHYVPPPLPEGYPQLREDLGLGVDSWDNALREVGSPRNVHNQSVAINTDVPPLLSPVHAELGWIDEEKIRRYAFPPSSDTRVFVCGLPGVYLKLCGPRNDPSVLEGSALHSLGYTADMVVKF